MVFGKEVINRVEGHDFGEAGYFQCLLVVVARDDLGGGVFEDDEALGADAAELALGHVEQLLSFGLFGLFRFPALARLAGLLLDAQQRWFVPVICLLKSTLAVGSADPRVALVLPPSFVRTDDGRLPVSFMVGLCLEGFEGRVAGFGGLLLLGFALVEPRFDVYFGGEG